ncbi:acetyltransferase [Pontixanthobacter gangjinensis]
MIELRRLAIEQIGISAYSKDQVEAWASKVGNAQGLLARFENGDLITVACDTADRAIGYSLLGPGGHLDHLYCHPEHTGQGLADKLLAQSELIARQNGARQLHTEASVLARPAFLRAGYIETERRDFEIEFGGRKVPIHNFAMVKQIG